jgi:hypothetical protein
LLAHLVSPCLHLIFVLTNLMAPVNKVLTKKRGRGRPRKEDAIRRVVAIALSPTSAERLAKWMAENGIVSKSEAGRILLEESLGRAEKRSAAKRGLAADPPPAPAKPRRTK